MKHRLLYFSIFGALIVFVGLLGFYYVQHIREKEKKEAYSNLSVLANLKIKSIVNWRSERLSEAKFLYSNEYFNSLISAYSQNPVRKNLNNLTEFFRPFLIKADYIDAVIIINNHKPINFIENKPYNLTDPDKEYIENALTGNKVVLSKIQKDAHNKICIQSFVPLIRDSAAIGVLILRIDPQRQLFPLISAKPQLSETFESFIVRQDGDSVIFLNSLTQIEKPALSFKLPLTQNALPAAMVVKGLTGIYEGIDYAGNRVLSHLDKIPDSPWFIVSKINIDEIYAPLETQLTYIFAGAIGLVVIFGLIVFLAWKDQRIRYLHKQLELEKFSQEISNAQRETAEALTQSESKLLEAQSLAHLGSWDLDLEKNVLTWTDEVYRIFGLQPQEFAASYEAFLERIHPEDREAVNNAYSNSLKNGMNSYEIEHRIIRNGTGEVRFVHEKCRHLRDKTGKIIRSIGMVQDITEQVKGKQALSLSEEKFSKAFSANPNALVISHIGTGKILDVNETFLKMFGYSKSEVIGKTSLELNVYVNPEDRNIVKEKVLKDGYLRNFESRQKLKNGKERITLFSVELLEMSFGKTMLTIIQDITEQKENELALKESEYKLKETLRELMRSNKDLEEFAYTASHDLQEPIRMIKSYAQLLEMRNALTLDGNSKQYLTFISDGASRMQQLVNDLLRYSRVTTKKNIFTSVNCNLIVQDVLKDLKLRIEDDGAIITNGELPVIMGDETQLRQLFQNLLHNALKFRSERTPEIKIECEKRNEEWLFSISDNGIGIDSLFYDRIFVIFQRLHDRDKYPGTGIGLALCKKIVERHGGQIFVKSELDKGTVFYFTIPAIR